MEASISKAAVPSLGCQQIRSFWVVLTLSQELRTCQMAVSSHLNAALLLPSPTPAYFVHTALPGQGLGQCQSQRDAEQTWTQAVSSHMGAVLV